jgi:hypothetical protein
MLPSLPITRFDLLLKWFVFSTVSRLFGFLRFGDLGSGRDGELLSGVPMIEISMSLKEVLGLASRY